MMRAARFCAIMLMCAGCERGHGPDQRVHPAVEQVAFEGAGAASTSGKLAHGERLTRVLGCRGCHGDHLEGQLWDDDPKGYGITWASNLTRSVPTMTESQLRDLLTKGIHPRRAELWVMPSELFQHLEKRDLEALLAYLRVLKPSGDSSPDPVLGPVAMAEAKSGKIKPAAVLVEELRNVQPPDLGSEHSLGRYITKLTCAECHGPELKGVEGDTPDLIVASAYNRTEFERLITQGVPTGDRKLQPLMQAVAKSRFSKLTERERDALYAYLKALADVPNR
jgi:mono/diheme cytochrome c family protein